MIRLHWTGHYPLLPHSLYMLKQYFCKDLGLYLQPARHPKLLDASAYRYYVDHMLKMLFLAGFEARRQAADPRSWPL